ncbi:MAG: TolC family protein [Pirellulales bacterium]
MDGNRSLRALGVAVLALWGGISTSRAETLPEAWAAALSADQRLEASRFTVSAQQQGLCAAQAERMPQFGVASSYTVWDNQPAILFNLPIPLPLPPMQIPMAQRESFAMAAKASLPLYTSGRISEGIEAAGANLRAAHSDSLSTALDVKMRVADAYVNVLRSQRAVEVTDSNVKTLTAHSDDVQKRYDQNVVAKNDLLAAQVSLANARQRAIQAQTTLDTSRAAYNRALGRPLIAPVQLEELAIERTSGDPQDLTTRAMRLRPEIGTLSAQAQALRHRAESLRALTSPQVSVEGGHVFQENRYQAHEGLTSAAVVAQWNMFDGGRSRHQAAALLQQAESVLRLRADLETVVALQIRQAWLDVQETRQRIQVTRQAIDQAEENLRVTRIRYDTGAGTNTEVLDAETLRTQSYRNYYEAGYDAALADQRLHRAVGDL